MKKLLLFCTISGIFQLTGCISNVTAPEPATQKPDEDTSEMDECNAIMQAIAENCFSRTAFLEDGTTPARVLDENGNDLGEVDQKWAANYCECFAQIAFQTFSCETIKSHEKLDDDAYEKTYANIIHTCTTASLGTEKIDNPDEASLTPAE